MPKGTPVRATPEHRDYICETLLGGGILKDAVQDTGYSRSTVRRIAHECGLRFVGHNEQGKWVKQEGTTTMTTDHDATNGATETAAAAAEQSIDADIQEALDLLSQAEHQRKTDLKTIEQLQRQLHDAERSIANLSNTVDRMREQREAQDTRLLQVETENKRLMDKLKSEISRGLLRQSIDSFRKVLP